MRKLLGKKYSTMIRLRTSLLSTLLLAFVSFSSNLQANELKDISQLLAQGQSAQALDKVNAYLDAKPRDVSGQFLKRCDSRRAKINPQMRSGSFPVLPRSIPNFPNHTIILPCYMRSRGGTIRLGRLWKKAIRTHPSYATAHEKPWRHLCKNGERGLR